MARSIPIHQARNLGPVSAEILPALGVRTLADLKKLGWEEVAMRVMSEHPRFINLNMLRALVGAYHDVDFRQIPEDELIKARSLLKVFKGQK